MEVLKMQMNSLKNNVKMKKLNRHMTHAEDVVLKGLTETKWTVKMLSALYGNMTGYETPMNLSVKIDGAPAIFAWSKFPGIPSAGIAMKGLFGKTPKYFLSSKEIDENFKDRPELAYKLNTFFKYLKKIKIPEGEIWQGDFLFDDSSLSFEWIFNIDEKPTVIAERCITFHPNTILYAIPNNSKKFRNAKVGICWHTRYKGKDLENVVASYDAHHELLKKTKGIFMTDPFIKKNTCKDDISVEEAKHIEKNLAEVLEYSFLFDGDRNYHKFLKNGLADLMLVYGNKLIKNKTQKTAKEFIDGFKTFLMVKFAKIAKQMKTSKGSVSKLEICQSYLDFIEENKLLFYAMRNVVDKIRDIKHIFIKKLNPHGEFDTYIKTIDAGIIPTDQEGFALADMEGNAIKLINRLEFSYNNFSPNIVKGWQ